MFGPEARENPYERSEGRCSHRQIIETNKKGKNGNKKEQKFRLEEILYLFVFCRVRDIQSLVFSVVLCVLYLSFVSICLPWSCMSSDFYWFFSALLVSSKSFYKTEGQVLQNGKHCLSRLNWLSGNSLKLIRVYVSPMRSYQHYFWITGYRLPKGRDSLISKKTTNSWWWP